MTLSQTYASYVAPAARRTAGRAYAVAASRAPEGLVTIAPSAGLASMYDHQFQAGVVVDVAGVDLH